MHEDVENQVVVDIGLVFGTEAKREATQDETLPPCQIKGRHRQIVQNHVHSVLLCDFVLQLLHIAIEKITYGKEFRAGEWLTCASWADNGCTSDSAKHACLPVSGT